MQSKVVFIFQGDQKLDRGAAQFTKEMNSIKELVKKFRFEWEIMEPIAHGLFMIAPERKNTQESQGKKL